MTKIADLGFHKGIIVETIVSTYSMNGQANAAPMGATLTNPKRICLKIYTSSLTYRNLKSSKSGVVNVTSNPTLFYCAAFKEANPNGQVPEDWFEKAETVDAPKLRAAEAHLEVTIADIRQFDAERVEVICDIRLVRASTISPKVYCRALFATIEAIVHATRVEAFISSNDRKKREQALKLLETIEDCNDVVNRVAPNSRYSEIMTDLKQRIDSWRVKGESLH